MKYPLLKITKMILSLVMAFSLLLLTAGCAGGPEPASTPGGTTTQAVQTDGGQTDDTNAESTVDTQTTAGGQTGGSSAGSQGTGGTTARPPASATGSQTRYIFPADPYSAIPAGLKGTTVKVLLWHETMMDEKTAAAGFTQKTGIKVQYIRTTTDQYATKLVSLISAKDAPDVAGLLAENFVSTSINMMQEVDRKTFFLDDPIWDKQGMDLFKLRGKYFGVSIAGSWLSSEMAYGLYYNDSLFKREGMETPGDLYKAGKWNWDTFYETAKELKSYGYEPYGPPTLRTWMLTAGTDFVKYDGQKYVNNISDPKLENAYKFQSKLIKEGLQTAWSAGNFANGRLAMMGGILYGMRKDSGWGHNNMKDTVGVVPLPSPKGSDIFVPQDIRMWGVPKGAKNKEAVVYFLRYWLDPKNVDMKGMFMNSSMEQAFNDIIGKKKYAAHSLAVVGYSDSSVIGQLIYEMSHTDEAQINTLLQTRKSVVQTGVDKVNQALGKLK